MTFIYSFFQENNVCEVPNIHLLRHGNSTKKRSFTRFNTLSIRDELFLFLFKFDIFIDNAIQHILSVPPVLFASVFCGQFLPLDV